jgi:hypothetical protein
VPELKLANLWLRLALGTLELNYSLKPCLGIKEALQTASVGIKSSPNSLNVPDTLLERNSLLNLLIAASNSNRGQAL